MKLSYERRGTGEPLVLLHGIGHHWRAWQPVLDRLAIVHDVIAIDLPGFGESPVPDRGVPAGIADAVENIAEFFAESGLERPHVAGNSLGGAMALELAAAGLASSATALSPAGFYTRAEIAWGLGVLRMHRAASRLPRPVLRATFALGATRALSFGLLLGRPRRLSPADALADALALRNARAFAAVAKSGHRYAFSGLPSECAVPVTVAWGTRDRILLYRQAARAKQRIPTAHHVPLPGCGHVPMHDDPDLVASVILDTTRRARTASPMLAATDTDVHDERTVI